MAIIESNIVTPAGFQYETVAASQTAQVLGNAGATGDRIERLVITSITAVSATVTLIDGSTSIVITAANTPIGVYVVDLSMYSMTGPWKVTTGAGASVIAIGKFSE